MNQSDANVHFLVIYGVSQEDVFCVLRDFLTSKRDNHLCGSAMIAMPARHLPARALQWQAGRPCSGKAAGKEWLPQEPIRTFIEK